MGSGKSTLGSRLARKIGFKFIDMDRLIEETADMTIPEIFREHGEEVFRKWEHDILLEICEREKIVVSTGGGAPCHDQMIRIMNQHGTTIYIRLSPESLRDRLIHSKTKRPLIEGKSAPELLTFITGLLASREAYYKQARYIINGVNLSPDKLVELLI